MIRYNFFPMSSAADILKSYLPIQAIDRCTLGNECLNIFKGKVDESAIYLSETDEDY